MRTHYDILGVPPSASADEVKRAYHRRAREHHPDVRVGASGDPMVAVNAAWAVLGDPVRRRTYDRELARRMDATDPLDAEPDDFPSFIDFAGVGGAFEPDPEPRPYTPADAIVLVPVGLLAVAVACFAFSTMTEAPALLLTSVVLLAVAAMSFAATPLLVLRRSVRRRTAPGTDRDPRS
jgi:curved DNA-binding protein CbpA